MLYRKILKIYFKHWKIKIPENKTDKYNLIIFTGFAQLDMLNVCLKSILSNFDEIPHIFIVTDLSLTSGTCKKVINWFPDNNISIISGVDCLSYHQERGNDLLKNFALQNTLGLKLAAILQIAELGKPLIYNDTDVIWFRDPLSDFTGFLNSPRFNLALSQDIQPAYDANLITAFTLYKLNQPPFLCSGIIFINSLKADHYKTIKGLLPTVITESTHFSEQTIFAILNKENGDFILDKQRYIMSLDDMDDLLPNKNSKTIARHYIGGVRHLFWRDAVWLN